VLNGGNPLQSGVAATPTGKVAGVRIIKLGTAAGLAVRAFSATGTVLLTRDKPALVLPQYPYDDMLAPRHVTAGGGPNRIAIAGSYNNLTWISVLDLP
jgi:hypothetical protein